jgi:hypothetical protein
MKIILNNISKALMLGLFMMFAYSCADPDAKPILTFDDAIKGSYPRVTSEAGSAVISPLDVAGSSYQYTVEFVDEAKGANVTELKFQWNYSGDDISAPSDFTTINRLYGVGDFSVNADGFASIEIPAFTGDQLEAEAGITITSANLGETFTVTSTIIKDGMTFGSDNSSSTVTGAAFAGQFDVIYLINCPSDVHVGAVDIVADYSIGWVRDAATSATSLTAEIVDNGDGSFDFVDWSFGAYDTYYGCCTPAGNFSFKDVCNDVTFATEGTDSYGDSWEFETFLSADGLTMTMWAHNYTYAVGEDGIGQEAAKVTVTFPTAQTWNCTNCVATLAEVGPE